MCGQIAYSVTRIFSSYHWSSSSIGHLFSSWWYSFWRDIFTFILNNCMEHVPLLLWLLISYFGIMMAQLSIVVILSRTVEDFVRLEEDYYEALKNLEHYSSDKKEKILKEVKRLKSSISRKCNGMYFYMLTSLYMLLAVMFTLLPFSIKPIEYQNLWLRSYGDLTLEEFDYLNPDVVPLFEISSILHLNMLAVMLVVVVIILGLILFSGYTKEPSSKAFDCFIAVFLPTAYSVYGQCLFEMNNITDYCKFIMFPVWVGAIFTLLSLPRFGLDTTSWFQQALIACNLPPLTRHAVDILLDFLTKFVTGWWLWFVLHYFNIIVVIPLMEGGGAITTPGFMFCCQLVEYIFLLAGFFYAVPIIVPSRFIELVVSIPSSVFVVILMVFICPSLFFFVMSYKALPFHDIGHFAWMIKGASVSVFWMHSGLASYYMRSSQTTKEFIGAAFVFLLNFFVLTTLFCCIEGADMDYFKPGFYFSVYSLYWVVFLHLLFLLLGDATIPESVEPKPLSGWDMRYGFFLLVFRVLVFTLIFLGVCGWWVGWVLVFSEPLGMFSHTLPFIYWVYVFHCLWWWLIYLKRLFEFSRLVFRHALCFRVPIRYARIYFILLFIGLWLLLFPLDPLAWYNGDIFLSTL